MVSIINARLFMASLFVSSLSGILFLVSSSGAIALDGGMSAEGFRATCPTDPIGYRDPDCLGLIERVIVQISYNSNLCVPNDEHRARYVLERTSNQPSGPKWSARTLIEHSVYSFWHC